MHNTEFFVLVYDLITTHVTTVHCRDVTAGSIFPSFTLSTLKVTQLMCSYTMCCPPERL